jgi:hypothetical protein
VWRHTEWCQHQYFQLLNMISAQCNKQAEADSLPPRPWLTSVLFLALIVIQLRDLPLDSELVLDSVSLYGFQLSVQGRQKTRVRQQDM